MLVAYAAKEYWEVPCRPVAPTVNGEKTGVPLAGSWGTPKPPTVGLLFTEVSA